MHTELEHPTNINNCLLIIAAPPPHFPPPSALGTNKVMRRRGFPLESVTIMARKREWSLGGGRGRVWVFKELADFWVHRPLTQLQYTVLDTAVLVCRCFVSPEERATTLSWLRRVQEVLRGIAHGLNGPWRIRRNSPKYHGCKSMHPSSNSHWASTCARHSAGHWDTAGKRTQGLCS